MADLVTNTTLRESTPRPGASVCHDPAPGAGLLLVGVSMGNNPAVLWYVDDWISGTHLLTRLERGAYHDLLMEQFGKGGAITMDHVKRCLGSDFDSVWPNIADKFVVDGDKVYNSRMLQEMEKRRIYCTSRADNRRKKPTDMKTYDSHMGNGNGNEDGDRNRNDSDAQENATSRRFTPPTVDEVRAYCLEQKSSIDPQAFVDHYEAVGWMRGKSHIKSWRACVRTWNNRPTTSPKHFGKRGPTREELIQQGQNFIRRHANESR